MNAMMKMIRSHDRQRRPSVVIPDFIAKCSYCDNPFDVERNEFYPYCFTDTFPTWIKAMGERDE